MGMYVLTAHRRTPTIIRTKNIVNSGIINEFKRFIDN